MRITLTTLLVLFISLTANSQTCITEEIKIKYRDGLEVFNVCKTNPKITFYDFREYSWYTEFSKVKSTMGGTGGQLLHGNYKFYNEKGNLLVERNYSLGVEHGDGKEWDIEGNIIAISKIENGIPIYLKFKSDDENYWIEHNGALFLPGWIKRQYTLENRLEVEEKMLANFHIQKKEFFYYEGDNQIKEEYTIISSEKDSIPEKYKGYYENGKTSVEGEFFSGISNSVKVGKWKWYNKDGTLRAEEEYKADREYWPNRKLKMIGGYIYDNENDTWLKSGLWQWFSEEGTLLSSKRY